METTSQSHTAETHQTHTSETPDDENHTGDEPQSIHNDLKTEGLDAVSLIPSNPESELAKSIYDMESSNFGPNASLFDVKMSDYICAVCGKVCSNASNLKRHLLTHTCEKRFQCDECLKTFTTNSNLIFHKRRHTGEKPFHCDRCEMAFVTMGDLTRHYVTHTGEKPYVCQECGKAFAKKYSLDVHERIHSGAKPHVCQECGKSFSDRRNMSEHVKIHSGDKPWTCEFCGNKFAVRRSLLRHRMTHNGEKPFTCNECGRGYTRRMYLENHKCTPLPIPRQRRQQCSHCDKSYSRKSDLRQHFSKRHPDEVLEQQDSSQGLTDDEDSKSDQNEDPIESSVGLGVDLDCIKAEPEDEEDNISGSEMDIHTNETPQLGSEEVEDLVEAKEGSEISPEPAIDTQIRPVEKLYACDKCELSFSDAGERNRHQLTHTGMKPYQCSICWQSFFKKISFDFHLRQHHTSEKPRPLSLKSVLAHTGEKPWTCEYCQLRFAMKLDLMRHRLTHTSAKPFRCEVCLKEYSRATHLRQHRCQGPPTVKAFPCEFCDKSYVLNKDRLRHIRRLHGDLLNVVPEPGNINMVAEPGNLNMVPEPGNFNMVAEPGNLNMVAEPGNLNMVPEPGNLNMVPEPGDGTDNPREGFVMEPRTSIAGQNLNPCLLDNLKGEVNFVPGAVDIKQEPEDPELMDGIPKIENNHAEQDERVPPMRVKLSGLSGFGKVLAEKSEDENVNDVDNSVIKFEEQSELETNADNEELNHSLEVKSLYLPPITCNQCGRSFRKAYDLNKHYRTHTGEKPYSCHECGKKFAQITNLRRHERTHTGEKPHHCDVCFQTFSRRSGLKKHLVNVHKRRNDAVNNEDGLEITNTVVGPENAGLVGDDWKKEPSEGSDSEDSVDDAEGETCLASTLTPGRVLEPNSIKTEPVDPEIGSGEEGLLMKNTSSISAKISKPLHHCKVCGKGFIKESKLHRHFGVHTGEKPYKCDICFKTFGLDTNLARHMKLHSGEKPFTCDICFKSFARKFGLKRHLLNHVTPNKKQGVDTSETVSEIEGNEILEEQDPGKEDEESVLEEGGCSDDEDKDVGAAEPMEEEIIENMDETLGVYELKREFSAAETGEDAVDGVMVKREDAVDEEERESLETVYPVQVVAVGERTNDEDNENPDVSSDRLISGSDEAEKILIDHNASRTGSKTCKLCSKTFMTIYDLKCHSRSHTGEKPYACEFCGKCFSLANNLARHRRLHSGLKPFTCQYCQQTFTRKAGLETHVRTHTGEKPFSCLECGQKFSLKVGLKRHSMIHSGERPFKCDQCEAAFRVKGDLQTHLRIHSGEKPYACETCQKPFKSTNELSLHRRTHTGYKPYLCKYCQRPFSDRSALRRHFLVHTGEKPWVCEICSRTFSRKHILETHRRTHTGEKPYWCQCGESFIDSSGLSRHKRVHQGQCGNHCNEGYHGNSADTMFVDEVPPEVKTEPQEDEPLNMETADYV